MSDTETTAPTARRDAASGAEHPRAVDPPRPGRGADVLVVEDDPTIREALVQGLGRAGFAARSASDGPSGLAAFFSSTPALVLLDVMLPGLDGIAVCRAIRAAGTVPVVMLTARSTDGDIIAGLRAGADDYVVKPFSPPVLFARVETVLRRSSPSDDPQISVGAFVVDTVSATVSHRGHRIALTPTEYRLFVELARRRDSVCTRQELLAAVWSYAWGGDERLVDVHVQRLRSKVGAECIQTVWGQGYRFDG